MVFRHAPIPRKGSGKQQQQQLVSTKFIPKLLTKQQKELRVKIAQDMLDCANNDVEFTLT